MSARWGPGSTRRDRDSAPRRSPTARPAHQPLRRLLAGRETAGAHFVRPTLVGEVEFTEWTTAGRLRQPMWRGLRPDKSAEEVVVE